MLETLLSPQSIAIIGGSEDVTKPGGRIIRNILSQHFTGKLMIVNPKSQMIQGVKAYPSINDLPLAPELALIAVPARYVRQALEDLAHKGAKAVVILSSGFGEVNPEGKREEQLCAEIANRHGMLLLGPNCSGVMSYAHASKFAGIIPEMDKEGIDFLSGSGATIDYLAEQAIKRGLLFNSFLTVGNSAQSGVTDLLGLFDQQSECSGSPFKILYMETVTQPQALLEHARSLTKKGCILAGIKAGTTQAGNRAAASHTGAMVSNDVAVQALFDKSGVIRLESKLELIDVANALVCTQGKVDGRRACIITDAGGPGVMLADELNRQGIEVPDFGEQTRKRLKAALPAGAGVNNPVDCLPTRSAAVLSEVISIIQEEEVANIDYILFVIGDSGLADNWEIYEMLIRAMESSPIPILPSFCTAISSRDALQRFRQAGKSYFEDEVFMGRALGQIVNRPRLYEAVTQLHGYNRNRIQSYLVGLSGALSPQITRHLLEAAGLKFPAQVELSNKNDLLQIDFDFPWVMKVIGPLHKSDVGGVRIGVKDLKTAQFIWDELMQIHGACGVLVQQMITGTEVIMGANREEGFGHLVAFGLGGIYTEALKDIRFALAPLSIEEAEKMILSLRAFPILKGIRGEAGMDIDLLKDWLIRIGLLVNDFPMIREMDLNPIKGRGSSIYIVDARIIVD